MFIFSPSRNTYLCIVSRRRGRGLMVVGFTTTYAVSAYHHSYGEFEPRSWRDVQNYGIHFVSNLQQVGFISGFLHK